VQADTITALLSGPVAPSHHPTRRFEDDELGVPFANGISEAYGNVGERAAATGAALAAIERAPVACFV
jgi:hypothetical protein